MVRSFMKIMNVYVAYVFVSAYICTECETWLVCCDSKVNVIFFKTLEIELPSILRCLPLLMKNSATVVATSKRTHTAT